MLYSSMYEPINESLVEHKLSNRVIRAQRDIRWYTRNTLRMQAQNHYNLWMSPDVSTINQNYFAWSPLADFSIMNHEVNKLSKRR